MKLALCDDSAADLARLTAALAQYNAEKKYPEVDATAYDSSLVLFDALQAGALYDAYVLDMLMPGKTGLELAKRIRKAQPQATIIYTTATQEFALDAFAVHAARYLLKPVRTEAFFEALDYAQQQLFSQAKKLDLKTSHGRIAVVQQNIEYIECVLRCPVYHLLGGKVITGSTMRTSFEKEIDALLSEPDFEQIHKSFVVNLAQIDLLMADCVVMKSGARLPVARSRMPELRRSYLEHTSNSYR